MSDAKGDVELQLRGEGLDKKDFFGKSDPYLELLSMSAGGAYVVFHKTEVRPHILPYLPSAALSV